MTTTEALKTNARALCAYLDGTKIGKIRREWIVSHEYPGFIAISRPDIGLTFLATPTEEGVHVDVEKFDMKDRSPLGNPESIGTVSLTWTHDVEVNAQIWRGIVWALMLSWLNAEVTANEVAL